MQRKPSRSERKYNSLPPGDHAGSRSTDEPSVTAIHSPRGTGRGPVARTIQTRVVAFRLSISSNAIHRPSGENRPPDSTDLDAGRSATLTLATAATSQYVKSSFSIGSYITFEPSYDAPITVPHRLQRSS